MVVDVVASRRRTYLSKVRHIVNVTSVNKLVRPA
jgi:hypothetical protein